MIYTGLRPKELLEILAENVHLEEKYMTGGMKTEAGKDRIIPLNDKTIPLVKNRYDPSKKYLINNKYGNHYTYGSYANGNFLKFMNNLTILLHYKCIKKSPINSMFTGLLHIIYYLRNLLLHNALSLHSLCHFQEACNVSACYIVAFLAVFLCSIVQIVENINHDPL